MLDPKLLKIAAPGLFLARLKALGVNGTWHCCDAELSN